MKKKGPSLAQWADDKKKYRRKVKDIEESKVKVTVGTAKLKIHSVGKINIKNRNNNLERIIELVKKERVTIWVVKNDAEKNHVVENLENLEKEENHEKREEEE